MRKCDKVPSKIPKPLQKHTDGPVEKGGAGPAGATGLAGW